MTKKILILIILSCISCFALSPGDIIINELMWMGTSRSSIDEFLELRSMTGADIDFASTPIDVFFRDSLIFTIDEGVLEGWRYFLISRLEPENSQVSATIDLVEDNLILPNNNSCISLRYGSTLIDQADDCIGSMSAGRYVPGLRWWSMERDNPPGDGTVRENWHYGCLQVGWRPGSIERGTPGATNYENIPPFPPDSLVRNPEAVGDDSTITLEAFGVEDLDDLPRPVKCFFEWICDGMVKHKTVDSTMPSYTSVLPSDSTDPGQVWTARITLYDDTDSVGYFYSDTFKVHWEKQDIIINEIMWMGSSIAITGEWIELYNRTEKVCDFSKTPFSIYGFNSDHYWVKLFDIDSLTIQPDSFIVIARRNQAICNLAQPPDMIHPRLRLYDTQLKLRLYDNPDTLQSWVIDDAGDGGWPLSGHRATIDSAWYSMSRNYPPGDGTSSASWHIPAFTIGFAENAMERGTPGHYNHTFNSPPILYEHSEMYYPESGNMDSVFTFRVNYRDADGLPPLYVNLLADLDNDGQFGSHDYEIVEMQIAEQPDTSFASGVEFFAQPDSIFAQESILFSFRASDGHTPTLLGNPPFIGPEYLPTLSFQVDTNTWSPDTIRNYNAIVSPAIKVQHTGDGYQDFGLKILLPDSIPFTGEVPEATGGLTFAESVGGVSGNRYCLSALFIDDTLTIDTIHFNQESSSDDIIIDELLYSDFGQYNLTGENIGHMTFAGDVFDLYFRFDPPAWTVGPYSHHRHTVVVELWAKFSMP
ncbi:MAG: hypothetical protein ACLFSQ_12065 [Candidatus Zixiibacteriota bacterium]